MDLKTFKQHEWELTVYLIQYREQLAHLEEQEASLRNRVSEDPKANEEAIKRNGRAWAKEWGANGWRRQELNYRHAKEEKAAARESLGSEDYVPSTGRITYEDGYSVETFSEEEMDDMYQQYLEREKEEHNVQQQILDHEQATPRYTAMRELRMEQEAVRALYRNEKKPIPNATEKRLEQQLTDFDREWSNKNIPLHEDRIKDQSKKDFKHNEDDVIKSAPQEQEKQAKAEKPEAGQQPDFLNTMETAAFLEELKAKRERNQTISNKLRPR